MIRHSTQLDLIIKEKKCSQDNKLRDTDLSQIEGKKTKTHSKYNSKKDSKLDDTNKLINKNPDDPPKKAIYLSLKTTKKQPHIIQKF